MERLLYNLEVFLKKQISRQKFLKICLGWLLVFISQNQFLKLAFAKTVESTGRKGKGIKGKHDIVLSEGKDSYQNTIQAVKAMGGMELFVKKGDIVLVKPNMAWDRTPEYAANTDPGVVAAVVEMCYQAGAKRVNVFDVPCNDERRVYEHSGIQKAAEEKGAKVYFANHWDVVQAKFSYKSDMEGWPIIRDAVACDTFINVPVLKHHALGGLTLSMKNLMGVCSGTRGLMHIDLGTKLVDLTDFIKPDLIIIDATRALIRNGPRGGNLEDVLTLNQVIVATDSTLADTFASGLVKKDPMSVASIKAAMQRNFGSTDISNADIIKVTAS